ncbi:MAG TPA: hypothetical protein VH120_20975, partial [Gemmataceae bacterium]|nr:hypothetical protein [Gemmataceae bacterium]
MPQVVQWPAGPGTTSETRSPVVETCRHHLSLGDLVIIPSEAGYVAVANGLHAEAVARLAALRRNTDSPLPAIAVRGEADARDWVPDLGPIGR